MKIYEVKYKNYYHKNVTAYYINCPKRVIKEHVTNARQLTIERTHKAYGRVYYGNDCELLDITTVNILETAKKEKVEIEVYKSIHRKDRGVDSLHTDYCEYLDYDITSVDPDNIVDWQIVDPTTYNKTIYANCGSVEDESKLVVLIEE